MKAICTVLALAVLGTAYAEDAATPEADAEESAEVEAAREDRWAEHRERMAAARERMRAARTRLGEAAREGRPVDEAAREMGEAARELDEAAREMAKMQMQRHVWHGEHCVACHADRAFLGVLIAEQGEHGITVSGLSPDGGAEKAGVVVDDVIVAIDGESLVGDDEPVAILHDILEDVAPGDAVELVVLRDDETIPLEVVTTAPVADIGRAARRLGRNFGWGFDRDFDFDFDWRERPHGWLDRRRGRDGLRLVNIGEDLGDYFGVDAGVLVLDTPAESEFMPGDILKRIDGAAVSSAADAHRLLRRLTEDAQAEVRRKNRKVMVGVSPPPQRERRRVIFLDADEQEEHEEED